MYVSKVAVAKSGNQYFDVKLKTAVDGYTNIRIMMSSNSGITPEYVNAKKALCNPVTLTKISSMESGTNFFNSGRGSKIVEAGCKIDFKMDEAIDSPIASIKQKATGDYIVSGCIRWIGEPQEYESSKAVESKKNVLRECVLMDSTDHICLTVWGNFLDELKENAWFRFTSLAVKQYHGTKLTTTLKTIIEQLEDASVNLNWDNVVVLNYLKHEKQEQKKLESIVCCPDILNISIAAYHPLGSLLQLIYKKRSRLHSQ